MIRPVVVALDVGGTSVKGGLVDPLGGVEFEIRRPTGTERGVQAVLDGITTMVRALLEGATPAGLAPVSIGIGVPGIVDVQSGIARYAANLGWRDVPLGSMLQAEFGLPVAVGHDVRLAGLAEARVGAGSGVESVFFVSIGTGIAGTLCQQGQIYDGATGQAGEVGHLVVRPGGPLCACGNRGCLEAIASAARIADRYSTGRGSVVSAARVVELVGQGDSLAVRIWAEAIDALADGLAMVTSLIDPGRIVIGGGLSLAGDTLLSPLTAALPTRLTFRPAPPLDVTVLGDLAGVIGAALHAWDRTPTLRPTGGHPVGRGQIGRDQRGDRSSPPPLVSPDSGRTGAAGEASPARS